MIDRLAADIVALAGGVPLDFAMAALPVYIRIQFFLLTMPVVSERSLGMRVRAALAIALTFTFIPETAPLGDAPAQIAMLLASEALLGILLGLPVRLMSFGINIAASAIASVASLSQLLGIGAEASPHPIGNLMHYAGIALLIALGLPVMLIELIADSYTLFPPGRLPGADGLWGDIVGTIARGFQIAMTISAPFILGGLLYQALLGVISKVMPALPVVFIGSPAAIMLALMGLAFFAPFILSIWADAVLSTGPR
ncbi:MAG: flagellar biosynthetic protein FliR [Paracoccus sp. (in: a-proteobacteria)]|nr:flagellar biosynthetic protein FliR [Paracoccus sp. (in: a-proteobacteria)]